MYLEWECGWCGADNEMDENDMPLPCRDCGESFNDEEVDE
jgi:DNA-directed RNA polymerase subunit RPC12/RpoP